MWNIYYWKKSKKLIIWYIIIFIILIIIWLSIKWEAWDELIFATILTLPLLILFILDYDKQKELKIELKDKTIKLRNIDWISKEINYNKIKLIYVIIWNALNESSIQIIEKWWKIIEEINVKYIDNVKGLLENLYKKNVIICNIKIYDSYTNNINDPKAVFVWPITTGTHPPIQEPYAITRSISKKYWWVPEDETEQFERKNNLISWNNDDTKSKQLKTKKNKTKKIIIET